MWFVHVIIRTLILLDDIVGFEWNWLCFAHTFGNLKHISE